MALDIESGKIFTSPELRIPQGHISMHGRADLADYSSGIPASVEEVEEAIVEVMMRSLPELEAHQFGRVAVRRLEQQEALNL
ncbi:MAG TPA: hypothetical protein VK712_01400 [Verrucomicrobiae bacterium]|jgi:hypothetical protein|nr:hypothetical protein [Verrucomicrobiae bacterium]